MRIELHGGAICLGDGYRVQGGADSRVCWWETEELFDGAEVYDVYNLDDAMIRCDIEIRRLMSDTPEKIRIAGDNTERGERGGNASPH
jgi:hypothetical protein